LFNFRQYMHSLDLIVFGIPDIKSDACIKSEKQVVF